VALSKKKSCQVLNFLSKKKFTLNIRSLTRALLKSKSSKPAGKNDKKKKKNYLKKKNFLI